MLKAGTMADDKTQPIQGVDQTMESIPAANHEPQEKETRPSNHDESTNHLSDGDNTPSQGESDHSAPPKEPPPSGKWSNKLLRAWNWKPKPARYDPANPPEFTLWLNVLFGFVSRAIHHSPCHL